MGSSTKKSKEITDIASEKNDDVQSVADVQAALNGGSEIGELRKLLVGSEELSEVLPEAVTRSSKKDSQLSEATLPVVEENIRESVIRNPKVLAEALFPVIGPAIRKAISAALSTMVQSFNQTLEHSVSPKSVGWRLEAMRTGKSFGEVVMLKTLLYRVEQVFLIHRETGILLQHVAQNPQDTEDADMISAMLTAITDFAHDSFKSTENATLDSLKISGLNVWIEGSHSAILAAVIRGNPPLDLRDTFITAIERIQFDYENELSGFEGNSELFASAQPVLERCLRSQAEEVKKPGLLSPLRLAMGVLGLIVLVTAGYFGWDYWRWSGLLKDIRNEPGYVLTDYQRGWFTHSVEGLRDPLAGDPQTLLSKNRYDSEDVALTFREFQDTNPKFVMERARVMLLPPDGVKLAFANGKLTSEGGSAKWRTEAARLAGFISGVRESDFVPDDSALISKIEGTKLQFKCATTELETNPDEIERAFVELARSGSYTIDIMGHADQTGTASINRTITRGRAEFVSKRIQGILNQESLSSNLKLNAVGSEEPTGECSVSFTIKPVNQ